MQPISHDLLHNEMQAMNIPNIASATIRQILALASRLERHLGDPFVHLEMGNRKWESRPNGLPFSKA